MGTPIDTGRARASWVGAIGSPDLSYDIDEPPFPEGGGPATYGDTIVRRANAVVNRCKLGQMYFLSNSQPYINRLEYGWSPQNAGWIREAQYIMKREWPYRFKSAFRNVHGVVDDSGGPDDLALGGPDVGVFSNI